MCHVRGIISFSSLLFCFRSADFLSVELFTLGAREQVPGYRHIVLCSHFEYLYRVTVQNSYALSDVILKQWTARNLQKLCAQRDPVPIFVPEFYRGYLKKGCVHVSAQRVPYLGRPCLGTKCSESCKIDRSSDLLRKTWPVYAFKFVITEKTLKRQEYLVASVNSLQSIQAWQETRLIFLITFFSTMLFCFPMNVFDLANFDFKCGPLF